MLLSDYNACTGVDANQTHFDCNSKLTSDNRINQLFCCYSACKSAPINTHSRSVEECEDYGML